MSRRPAGSSAAVSASVMSADRRRKSLAVCGSGRHHRAWAPIQGSVEMDAFAHPLERRFCYTRTELATASGLPALPQPQHRMPKTRAGPVTVALFAGGAVIGVAVAGLWGYRVLVEPAAPQTVQ